MSEDTTPREPVGATQAEPRQPAVDDGAAGKGGWLDRIERLGNKVPHPAIIFAALCVLVIVLSAVLSLFNVGVTYEVAEPAPVQVTEQLTEQVQGGTQAPDLDAAPPVTAAKDVVIRTETTKIKSLLSIDGIRFLFTSFVGNFSSFSVVAVILVAMLGVGVAEESGSWAR
jgi:aminobenzoyl-glutamate transport protein